MPNNSRGCAGIFWDCAEMCDDGAFCVGSKKKKVTENVEKIRIFR